MAKFEHFDEDINLTCQFTPEGFKDLDEYLVKGGDIKFFEDKPDNLIGFKIDTLW